MKIRFLIFVILFSVPLSGRIQGQVLSVKCQVEKIQDCISAYQKIEDH